MSWRDGDYDPHGGRNAFRLTDDSKQSSSERAASLRAMRSFTQSIEDDGPPELPPSLDIDMMERVSMKTSDTNDTIIEVKKEGVDPQKGETQKYKMVVPGPGHSEQEHELHKSLIRDDEEDAEVEQVFASASSVEPEVSTPKTLNFAQATEELRSAYDQKIRKRPTTPTSACVLDGIAFFANSIDGSKETSGPSEGEKIKVSIPSRRRKTENMTEFFESMAGQIPGGGGGRRMSQSGRTTPLHDYEGDILDENPQYKDKAPPAPVVHRRSSIEWENFADMEGEILQQNVS
uniref:Uncharacterized protein n=1 Tax=Caenorhabditis japonica TaxID=281687 RepID=A0A8R1IYF9_CAEJA